jgi:hypothetical protein
MLCSLFAFFGAFALSQGCSSPNKGSGFSTSDRTSGAKSGGESSGDDAGAAGGTSGGDPGSFGGGGDGGGGGALDSGCATATAKTERAPVYMLIVLDGSGSMNKDDKWTAATSALDAIFDDLQSKSDKAFGVGLLAFSDQNDPSCTSLGCTGPYPGPSDVGIASVDQAQHDKLRGRIDSSGPQGDTPTNAALSGGYKELESFTPEAPLPPGGKKVLVLMSDGEPSDSDKGQDTALVAAEATKEISTFALGIGPFPSSDTSPQGYDPAFMGAIAQAGGTAPTGCNPDENANIANVCHFQITPGTSQA